MTRLGQLGFVWDKLTTAWEQLFAELTAYKETHGDCNVSAQWKENPKLGSWCSIQRKAHKGRELSPGRIKRLEQLGFAWDAHTVAWEQMFAALVAYKQTYGDCNVSQKWKDNPELGTWCCTQRTRYKINKLAGERIIRLAQLGFVLDPFITAWEQMFTALVAYKQTRGNCNVSQKWKDNPELGTWCGTQRKTYKRNELPPDRIARLQQIGFVWDPIAIVWEQMFAALLVYKLSHGDCNVRKSWKGDPELGAWCGTQRTVYKNNKLAADRVKRLEDIGFQFGMAESKRK